MDDFYDDDDCYDMDDEDDEDEDLSVDNKRSDANHNRENGKIES
jgi:hypothetical protein